MVKRSHSGAPPSTTVELWGWYSSSKMVKGARGVLQFSKLYTTFSAVKRFFLLCRVAVQSSFDTSWPRLSKPRLRERQRDANFQFSNKKLNLNLRWKVPIYFPLLRRVQVKWLINYFYCCCYCCCFSEVNSFVTLLTLLKLWSFVWRRPQSSSLQKTIWKILW